jgi:hypothetical protein
MSYIEKIMLYAGLMVVAVIGIAVHNDSVERMNVLANKLNEIQTKQSNCVSVQSLDVPDTTGNVEPVVKIKSLHKKIKRSKVVHKKVRHPKVTSTTTATTLAVPNQVSKIQDSDSEVKGLQLQIKALQMENELCKMKTLSLQKDELSVKQRRAMLRALALAPHPLL